MSQAHILIAEDEEGIRESLRLILEDEYNLTFARNGQEAVEYAIRHPFDLLLLDIKMPKLDGVDVMRQLHAKRIRLPVLILSAYQSVEVAKETVRLGALDYIPKPFDRDHVKQVVRQALTKPPQKRPSGK